MNVLVAVESDTHRMELSLVCLGAGCHVDGVNDSDKAVKECRRFLYQVVILDEWTWYPALKAAKRIRRLKRPNCAPIILYMSNNSPERCIARVSAHGVNYVLPKPVTEEMLLPIIHGPSYIM